MIKLILKPIMFLRRLYWRILRPTTVGVRALIQNQDGNILLVKHNYSSAYYLPGGKVEKGDDLLVSLQKELQQEVGIINFKIASLLGTYANQFEYKNDFISVFIITEFSQTSKKHFEIEKHGFYPTDKLPNNTSPGTKSRIDEYLKQKKINYKW